MYKFRKIIGKYDFPYHFKKVIVRYKKIGYKIDVLRQTACLVVNPVKVNKVWSGGAMVLGKLQVPGRPTIWILVGQGPIALAVGAGGGCLDIFTLICPFFPLSPSL